MSSFAKKSKAGSQNAHQNASKPKRPFFDQSHTPEPFFQRQPEARKADQPDSKLNADKRLRRLDFSAVTRPPSDARLRVPSAGEIQGMLSSGNVDEAVVLSRVRKLLERMYRERKLRGVVNIDITMHELFPIPGVLDQAAFERYIDPTDREMVYKSVHEASIKPQEKDRENLKRSLESASGNAGLVANDKAGLEAVFGTGKHLATAAQNYRRIHVQLNELASKIDTNVTTDYNLDTEVSFTGGWAFRGVMHLRAKYVTNPFTTLAQSTFIHEAAHLSNPDIGDHGYYGSPGFESAAEETKINNAAHYEELPRRIWGVSSYARKTFTPGTSKSLTSEQKIRTRAYNYFRMAWHSAVMTQDLLRKVRIKQTDGKKFEKELRSNKKMVDQLLEVSQLMDMTLHEQSARPPEITLLDVTTAESIAREIHLAWNKVTTLSKDQIMSPLPFQQWHPFLDAAFEYLGMSIAVDSSLTAHGGILGDAKRDCKLVDWLHDHYHRIETLS
ncbi:hypothetical protein BIU88_05700 [Chlorobaculum limnaeum]|uniref:Uncharacterized protein n=1 Tax=Chlorobaculum limnaeum TaxID=274537 RepID=A0A1D8CXM4_CHLLM|nr:hypothetical protein [Chlorobaculum limnaeum]AOS83686.1 hypothetical protein BIU88_05700 [Chlorobaculum limnaeum]